MLLVGSDFSGIGAFNQALKRIGIEYKELFACDIDDKARETFVKNYGDNLYFPKDVYSRVIPVDELDIYVSTPPCQAFSNEGARKGEDDDRGVLFYNSLDFIKKNNPKSFVLENVRGLLTHDKGKTFKKWINSLNELNYNIHYSLLNAKDFNILQNRERVFIVGIRKDFDKKYSFPSPVVLSKKINEIYESDVCDSLFVKQEIQDQLDIKFLDTGISYRSNTKKGIDFANWYDTISLSFPNSKTRRGRVGRGLVNTLTTSCDYAVVLPNGLRKLTTRECYRFMDYPDSFVFNDSESQAKKQAGNSICVGVLENVIKEILKVIK